MKNYGKEKCKIRINRRIMLEDIINIADRTTSGNVAHNLAAIKVNSRCALNALNEFKEKHDIS